MTVTTDSCRVEAAGWLHILQRYFGKRLYKAAVVPMVSVHTSTCQH